MFKKTIISEFFTTVNFSIFVRTLSLLTYKLPVLKYWRSIKKIENKLLSYIWNLDSKIYSFYNWRSAIFHTLKIIWVKKNDEVIVSWYTCVSVANAVIQSWAKIIYSDINPKNLWFNEEELKNKINSNTKVIIVQHTFWKPSNIKKIIEIAKDNNILVIEDCAHSLWSDLNWKKIWSFWDFSIFSTGRDKVISWVTWGFLIINNIKYFSEWEKISGKLKMPWFFLVIRNLQYNLLWYKAYKLYDFLKLWRAIIFISRKLNLITEILSVAEKECNFKEFNHKLPNSLAYLALKELEQLEQVSTHRRSIAEYYGEVLNNKYLKVVFEVWKKETNNYFRYPILAKSEEIAIELYNYMKKNNVLLWNSWSKNNIAPFWTNNKKAQYIIWSCPISEDISKRILILPNHALVTPNDAKKIIVLLNNFKKEDV